MTKSGRLVYPLLALATSLMIGCVAGSTTPATTVVTPTTTTLPVVELPPPLVFATTVTPQPSATPWPSASPWSSTTPAPSATIEETPAVEPTVPLLITPQLVTPLPISPTMATFSPTPSPLATTVATSAAIATTPMTPTAFLVGRSMQGRDLEAYLLRRGPISGSSSGPPGNQPSGPRHVMLVGGIHGGYEWNTVLLAYELLDYFTANLQHLPPEITLHIIPSANPDGQFQVTQREGRFSSADVGGDTVPGRFNANGVDLNRNWDCRWSPTAVWRNTPVPAGSAPFSEQESQVLRDYFLQYRPELVIFLHSAANGVFASGCPDTDERSLELAAVYAQAAGYPLYEAFNAYPITGDAGDWLTTQGIASFTVELRNHHVTDWSQNQEGVLALLTFMAMETEE